MVLIMNCVEQRNFSVPRQFAWFLLLKEEDQQSHTLFFIVVSYTRKLWMQKMFTGCPRHEIERQPIEFQ